MRRVLLFIGARSAPYVWDVSSKKLRGQAYVGLFNVVRDLLDDGIHNDSVTSSLIKMAESGNPDAAEALLVFKRDRCAIKFDEFDVINTDNEAVS